MSREYGGTAANIAADLAAWTRLLGCHDDEELRDAGPGDTLRYRIWHIPARLPGHARHPVLKISPDSALEEGVPGLLAAALRPVMHPRLKTRDIRRVIHRFASLCVIYISGGRACMKDGLFLEMIGLPHAIKRNRPSPCIIPRASPVTS